jgi:putative phosphoribosyl transferase
MRFQDRREAGEALAERLTELEREGRLPDPVVLALPRGGVPVGDRIARALGAPLDVIVARKIGAPFQPELALGAVTGEGPPLYDPALLRHFDLSEEELRPTAEREKAEARRREELYREGRPPIAVAGRSAVVVDDGVATGSTARAALRSVARWGPARVALAIPVGSAEAAEALTGEVDEYVCPYTPSFFGSVGSWYLDFPQLSDDEVLHTLRVSG